MTDLRTLARVATHRTEGYAQNFAFQAPHVDLLTGKKSDLEVLHQSKAARHLDAEALVSQLIQYFEPRSSQPRPKVSSNK